MPHISTSLTLTTSLMYFGDIRISLFKLAKQKVIHYPPTRQMHVTMFEVSALGLEVNIENYSRTCDKINKIQTLI